MLDFIKEVLIPVILLITLFCIMITIPLYYSGCQQAKIVNEKYGTEYTCGDFFWAGNQINQEIKTIRVEGLKIK